MRQSYSNKEMTRMAKRSCVFHDHDGAIYRTALSGVTLALIPALQEQVAPPGVVCGQVTSLRL